MKENPNEVTITTYDKIMCGWHYCMLLTKIFENQFHETADDNPAKKLFEEAANDMGKHAAAFRKWLLDSQQDNKNK